jgi:hypothetical protein
MSHVRRATGPSKPLLRVLWFRCRLCWRALCRQQWSLALEVWLIKAKRVECLMELTGFLSEN